MVHVANIIDILSIFTIGFLFGYWTGLMAHNGDTE
jgi:hypothetical protein